MCGIAGGTGFTADARVALAIACSAIRRRGPDDGGTWFDDAGRTALGHVRLSIQDTSAAGHQPMSSADGRIVMVYNGEIYNGAELRAELEAAGVRFRGHSDSEILVNLFARSGADCFRRLNGIFAAAFWDRSNDTLTLVRDVMGVKPLYLAQEDGRLVFASEMKALLRAGWVQPQLEPHAVLRHLGLLWSPGSDTVVRGVRKLLPGHALEFKAGRVQREWRYADVAFQPDPSLADPEVAARRVAGAVQTAVQRQMISDVPLGAFLSGGLDSSAVVAFARREVESPRRVQCFSIEVADGSTDDEGFASDLPYAQRVAKHLDVDLHVVRAGSDMMGRLEEMVYLLDEPTPDPAALNALLICELARSAGIKVLLSGAGGDDIFTGYRRHFALMQERLWAGWPRPARSALQSLASKLPVGSALGRRIGKAFRHASLDADERLASYFLWLDAQRALALLSPASRAGLRESDLLAPMLETLHALPPATAPLNRMLYLEMKHFLVDHNLNYTDKMGMAAGVEVRVPLLDPDLVALAGALPLGFKQNGRTGKWIFKKAMEPYLPADVIYRPKTGFGAPLRRWLHGFMRPLVDDLLSPRAVAHRGVFDAAAVQQLLADDRSGRVDASYTLFALMCLELWCRHHMDRRYPVDATLAAEPMPAVAVPA